MLGVMATKKGTQGFHAIVPYRVLILDNWLESSITVRITRILFWKFKSMVIAQAKLSMRVADWYITIVGINHYQYPCDYISIFYQRIS